VLPPFLTPDSIHTALTVSVSTQKNDLLANIIGRVAAATLPRSITPTNVAQEITEIAKKFAGSFAERSGENLSDLLFDWLNREKEYRDRGLIHHLIRPGLAA